MIAKGDKPMPGEDDDQRNDHASAGDSPAQPELREGEIVGDEYPTTSRERGELAMYRKAINRRYPTSRRMRKRMVKRIEELVEHEKPDVALTAIGRGIDMEKVNQRDDNPGVSINAPGATLVVVKRDDWYGNRAHDLAAERAAASKASVALPGSVQDGGERSAVGKNGNGTAGHN